MSPLTVRRRALAQTALVAVAVGAGALTLTKVVWPGGWVAAVLGSLALVAAVVAGVRWAAQARGSGALAVVAPTLVGAVVAGFLWVTLSTSQAVEDPSAAPLPEDPVSAAFTALGRLHELAAQSVAPVDASAPVLSAILSATLVLYLLGDVLAVTLRSPVAAAVPALVLWMPSLVIVARVPVACVAATLLALLVLLAVSRVDPRPGARDAGTTTAAAVGVAAAVTAVSLVVGAGAVAVQQNGSRPLTQLFGSNSGTGRLGNNLDVLRDLGDRPDTTVMTVRASSEGGKDDGSDVAVGPLRVYTLTNFDGSSWKPDDVLSDADDVAPGQLLGSTGASSDAAGTVDVRVDPKLLPRYRLAVTTDPRSVQTATPSPLRYDSDRDEVYRVSGDGRDPYTLAVHPRDLTADQLKQENATFGADSGLPMKLRREALTVPDTAHVADVTALAKKITAGDTTDYAKALDLQTYFRDAQRFTYSTKAPKGGSDAVWSFLEAKEGYCVQFSTAMAVMLRTLGIPTRVGVGYLTRAPGADGVTNVTGQDAHAWPEVYFEQSGWVRFEPTPAVQSGIAPSYTDVYGSSQSQSSQPNDVPTGKATTDPNEALPEETATSQSQPIGTAATRRDGNLVVIVGVALLLVVAAAAATVVLARRRRSRPIDDAEEAWAGLRRRLASEGVTWPDSATPRQVPGLVAATVHDAYGTWPDDADAALRELARAVETERYARPTGTRGAVAVEGGTTQVGAAPGAEPADSPAVRWANLVDDVVAAVQKELSGRLRGGDAPNAPRGGRGTTRAS
ncbi:transglutaminaseTgpA domain-containing protein [Luteimicrobium sp. NPDC057192]|uniref:transglutaminaseTgpA domain-containing protein n=1 Tax=Luteimicrobium sp. NPDC057192 TaxID=3346042 RepID=UPI00362B3179